MTFVFVGLFILLMALVLKSSLGKPNVILKVMIHTLGGIVGLWLFDLILSVVGFSVPINIFTVLIVGLLGFPGVISLVGLQILGI